MIAGRRQPFVLVADDDRDTRELYRACFDTCGYRTAEAGTGSQAIVSAVEIVPDVLLTDYVLPDVDGLTIARRLKSDARTAAIRILMVTGYASPTWKDRAPSAGIDRVLLKPCLPQAVMREVSRTLSRPVPAIDRPGARACRPKRSTRVREEFGSLPGLALTAEQARLVFDLERDMCERILTALVAEGFLSRTSHGAYRRDARLKELAAERHVLVRHDQDDVSVGVRHAERQHLRHERPDLPRRKVDDGQHVAALEVLEADSARVSCADDFLMPISGPKSICRR